MASFAEIFDEFTPPETKSEEIGLARIDYVLVYDQNPNEDPNDENRAFRENYLFNLENNGLILKRVVSHYQLYSLFNTKSLKKM